MMLGENLWAHGLGNRTQAPREWPRPTGGLPVTWGDEQAAAQGEATRHPRANRREALTQNFRCSISGETKGLSGNLVLVFPQMRRTEALAAVDPRTRELQWRQNNEQLLEALAGQWLVVEGDEMIAHGQDPVTLVTAARRRGIQVPFIFFVEPRAYDTIKIGL